jgi:hypothetical protein
MTSPLPPGTFALHPYAEPPLAAGSYVVEGDVDGMPGPVAPMAARLDVVAPRFTMPPDQILGTFPPAGASGAFESRLPQVVLRRRTLPWERSTDLDAVTAPTPWLALVVVAEGEGRLLTNVPVAQCVTAGTPLPGMPADADVPVSACLEVPQEVVDGVFPAQEDLAYLAHVRAVDLADTELAMGDDDGWLAVVLANRLPQPPPEDAPPIRYLACLVNVEGQVSRLPHLPPDDTAYVRAGAVLDLRAEAAARYGPSTDLDTAVMKLPGSGLAPVAAVPAERPRSTAARPAESPSADSDSESESESESAAESVSTESASAGVAGAGRIFVASAAGQPVPTGSSWASGATAAHAATSAGYSAADAGTKAKAVLADGFAIDLGVLVRPMLRFPALAYWSFTVTAGGDFQYLAERVNVRLLGHVPTGAQTPDGDPVDPHAPADPGTPVEPDRTRPLPLVAETGHVRLDHLSRTGEPAPAWYRGPLTPDPVPRPALRPDGRPPLAHHADQVRRVVPDGTEDLGYAAAFEIGRLLALSQPGIVAALGRWRQEAYGAARTGAVVADAVAQAPGPIRDLAARPDVLATNDDGTRAGSLGVRLARAVAEGLGAQSIAKLPPGLPAAPASGVAAAIGRRLPDRDAGLLAALGVSTDGGTGTAAGLLAATADVPVATAAVDPARFSAALRTTLEAEAMRTAVAAQPTPAPKTPAPGPPGGS